MRVLRPPVARAWMPGLLALALLLVTLWAAACGGATDSPQTPATGTGSLKVLVAETFLADIVQNVAGDAASVEALMPLGADPHAYELTPAGAVKVAKCDVLIVNGAGFEPTLDQILENIGENAEVIEASAGLVSRTAREGEEVEQAGADEHHHDQGDPHFWLDPTLVVTYVENIRDGLSKADPANAATYAANAAAYSRSLEEIDTWIKQQVGVIPAERRLLVTNHESFGYFADRYGFTVVGTVVPSVGTGASPSAQQLARLIDTIKGTGIRAIFLETGSNPDLAEQVAAETGITVVTQLYTHSLTEAGGAAPTYLDMMRVDTEAIVAALK
jgi:ABC-type Zn uptake system ZnuABC Zn-binding protein ZnuA